MHKDLNKRDWHSINGGSKCLKEEPNIESPSWIVWMNSVFKKAKHLLLDTN